MIKLKDLINEGHKVYHTSYSSAVQEAERLANKKGFKVDADDIELSGRFDRVEEEETGVHIIDFKTSASRTQEEVDADLQLSIYALAAKQSLKKPFSRPPLLFLFEDEFLADLRHDTAGKLSMANSGPGTNGSQFFITHIPTPHLDDAHTIFGAVVSSADQQVVDSIEQGDKILSISIAGDYQALLEQNGDRITDWNQEIDANFPKLATTTPSD